METTAALIGSSPAGHQRLPTIVVCAASLVVVLWCVVDVTRRPLGELSAGRRRGG